MHIFNVKLPFYPLCEVKCGLQNRVLTDESNKKNEFLRNQISSQDEKIKSLEQELVESKAKIESLTSTKPVVDNRSVSVSFKPKTEKVYISHFKRNNNEKAYFARLDKGKISDIDIDVSKLVRVLFFLSHIILFKYHLPTFKYTHLITFKTQEYLCLPIFEKPMI